MPEKLRKNLTLPDEVRDAFDSMVGESMELRDAYMRLLRDRGWTLQSIADAVGDISRERARQCVESITSRRAVRLVSDRYPLPDPPEKPEKIKVERVTVLPSEKTLKRLKELKPLASKVRYSHKQYREEAEEYVALLWHAHMVEGVSVYRLAKLLDTIPAGIESRFVRYGYKKTKGTSDNYAPVKYRKASATK
jgi:hypothetical protein